MAVMLFWISFAMVTYAYAGYPLLLMAVMALRGAMRDEGDSGGKSDLRKVTIVIPVHNGEKVIGGKIANTLALDYPSDRLEVVVVSDGSRDGTAEIVAGFPGREVTFLETGERQGKAGALNLALTRARGEIIVFTDAAIILERNALKNLVRRFDGQDIGCVSGEDFIDGGAGEGLYGRYELFLRRCESRAGSIVGASGCFYAERANLVEPFHAGMAPDFLSVLRVVEKGYRAVSEKSAAGAMGFQKKAAKEFSRKARTFNRGMAALWYKRGLLNPFKYGFFAIELISHKLIRWLVPLFLLGMYCSNAALLNADFYQLTFLAQNLFYALAFLAYRNTAGIESLAVARVPLYFTLVNAALGLAWYRYLRGEREEIWEPTERA